MIVKTKSVAFKLNLICPCRNLNRSVLDSDTDISNSVCYDGMSQLTSFWAKQWVASLLFFRCVVAPPQILLWCLDKLPQIDAFYLLNRLTYVVRTIFVTIARKLLTSCNFVIEYLLKTERSTVPSVQKWRTMHVTHKMTLTTISYVAVMVVCNKTDGERKR